MGEGVAIAEDRQCHRHDDGERAPLHEVDVRIVGNEFDEFHMSVDPVRC